MILANQPHGRGRQLLGLLAKHGPLSHRGLMQIVEPSINKVRLSETLGRLVKRKLIIKKYDRIFRGSGVYYQINQNKKYWPEILKKIKNSNVELYQPQFRPKEHHHSEACALWVHFFEKNLDVACVLRDFEIPSSPLANRLLIQFDGESELLPDILILLTNKTGDGFVAIAVEIERYLKSKIRNEIKLKKYANETLLDGVLYICDDEGISSQVADVYKQRVASSANRINNYQEHFLLFKNDLFAPLTAELKLKTPSNFEVNFFNWVNWLTLNNADQRKDSHFNVQ